MLAVDTLRKGMGVVKYGFLPYDALLTLMSYFFAKSGRRAPSAAQMDWLKNWFWRASFAQHYGTGGPTRMGEDRVLIDDLIAGGQPAFHPLIQLMPQGLAEDKMTSTRSAIRNAYLCLLATLGPQHLVNNSPLDLDGLNASDFTSRELHHIFPDAYLRKSGPSGANIHALPNFCFLPAELNNRIRDDNPASYFAKFRDENPKKFEAAARTHLLPTGKESGIEENDYWKFLLARAALVHQEIGRLCGTVTTPREDERALSIRQVETSLRDAIHTTLAEAVGGNYWKTNIPSDIQEAVDKRIADEVKQHPELADADLTKPRARLDFCNVSDYTKIIGNGTNWRYFEPAFRNKEQMQHHLHELSEYRNAVSHNREKETMTELRVRAGEVAMLWLRNVLGSDDIDDSAEAGVDAGD